MSNAKTLELRTLDDEELMDVVGGGGGCCYHEQKPCFSSRGDHCTGIVLEVIVVLPCI
jgi:hypothetical protein